MRDLAAKAIVPSIKTRRRTVRRRAHDRARGNDTNRLTVCKPGQGSRIYAKHRARLLDRYSDAEHVSPLPHRVSSALICSLWYRLLCRHRQPFLLGKVAAAVADSLRKPPSLDRVRSPGIQHQGRGCVGRLVDPHMNRTAKPSWIKVDPTSTPLTRRRPRAGGQHHLEGPEAIANRLL